MWKIVRLRIGGRYRCAVYNVKTGKCNYAGTEQRMLDVLAGNITASWKPNKKDEVTLCLDDAPVLTTEEVKMNLVLGEYYD